MNTATAKVNDTKIIDGKAFALGVRTNVKKEVEALQSKHDITPGLAVVLVGDDPASAVYVRNKGKQTKEAGMNSFEFILPDTTTESELIAKVEELNADDKVNGILVQLPLPKHINEVAVIDAINPSKDVDGFHVINSGLLATGQDSMVPCTPQGCLMLLKDRLGDLSGLKALVIGRSNIVGKPMVSLLIQENCTVTLAHSHTKDLKAECLQADIIVAAVGKPNFVKGDWVKDGAVLIDVGINRIDSDEGRSKLVGDIDFDSAIDHAGAITPVPGGVGPMTIACLLWNTVRATKKQHNID
ncbi:MAG: bifunctional methylenetetrahydrofolate dehydrogenase/methenyltetrahydrofolate cyclohydrolase FolD [Rickettsiales bacterium]|nr:bifunctional methylenetetrahydrofolate dehydrogenase/methenyltetrahydrofolate cyclohydrolase FolD [Rickettsiales bacterium]